MNNKTDPFVHLHVHTDQSLLDGHSTVREAVKTVADLGQPALAITDHGQLGGVRKFWAECVSAEIKPIIGCEFYVAPGSRFAKEAVHWGTPEQRRSDVSGSGSYTHCTILATGDEGVRNLFRLYAASYSDGFYRKPRIDLNLLAAHSGGLIVTTGCAGGAVPTLIRLDQQAAALDLLGTMRDMFGDSLFIEIMEHNNPVDLEINPTLISLSRSLRVPVIATNDSHYSVGAGAPAHDALLCLQTGQKVNGVRTFKFEGEGYHLRSASEMEMHFREIPEALRNTLEIADRVEPYNIFGHTLRMPQYATDNPQETLRDWVESGIVTRGITDPGFIQDVNYELSVINNLDYTDYFLVFADLLAETRKNGIRVGPGRGSAGGCKTSYVLGITDLDPSEHGLLFERFLNPERVSLPDIDCDIDDRERDRVIDIARTKYGRQNVAQIGTYGTIKSRAALHDAARVLGKPRSLSNQMVGNLPPIKFGRYPTLAEGDWSRNTAEQSEVLELATHLEGRIRNSGVHAAGVVISPESLVDIIPVYKLDSGTGPEVTAYDMGDIDSTGLVKMDLLGLSTLGIIDTALELLPPGARDTFPVLSTKLKDMTDETTFDLLRKGTTLGVFQLDSPGMQQLLRSVKPDKFGDISAVLALYRPGPMAANAHHGYAKRKNGAEGVSYPHRDLGQSLQGILGDTYGLIVYQEQVLQILKEVCGYTYATAALIFDAMRKKDTAKMLKSKPDFVERMKERGYSRECTTALWDTLVPFSDYSFARAHSAGYGVISYWTAYLKANYPAEWMSAVLSRESDTEKLQGYVAEVSRMGIKILPPDINESLATWTPGTEGIRYGLASIKGLGEKAFGYVVSKRPYKSLDDFFKRANGKALNARTLSVLIQSGAFDSLCPHREELFAAAETLAERALSERRFARQGQFPLYSTQYAVTGGTFNKALRRSWEKELLGTSLSQEEIIVKPDRWLNENEFYIIRRIAQESPGGQRLSLRVGFATVEVGYVQWSDSVDRQFRALTGFTLEES